MTLPAMTVAQSLIVNQTERGVHTAQSDQASGEDDLYAVAGHGLPVPWHAISGTVENSSENAILLLKKEGDTLVSMGWHSARAAAELAKSHQQTDQHHIQESDSDQQPLTVVHVDRSPPTLKVSWGTPMIRRGETILVRPDTKLNLQLSDDTGVSEWRAQLNNGEASLDDLWPAGNQKLEVIAMDRAGNQAIVGELSFVVDDAPPEIACDAVSDSFEPTQGRQFYKLPIQVKCEADDDSGVASLRYMSYGEWQPVTASSIELDRNSLVIEATDALNQTRRSAQDWPVDDSPPTIELTLPDGGRIQGSNVYLKVGTRIGFDISDGDGVGVKSSSYRYNRQKDKPVPGTLKFLDRGWYKLVVTAQDHAGHEITGRWNIRAGSPKSQRPRR